MAIWSGSSFVLMGDEFLPFSGSGKGIGWRTFEKDLETYKSFDVELLSWALGPSLRSEACKQWRKRQTQSFSLSDENCSRTVLRFLWDSGAIPIWYWLPYTLVVSKLTQPQSVAHFLQAVSSGVVELLIASVCLALLAPCLDPFSNVHGVQ